jgi:eukaryotic-like serine/threonine-protein kinase
MFQMSVAPGVRLGPYEIVDSIGAGGMGEVWRARDTRLEREVAIKVLPTGFAENEQFLQRFEREARTISSLNHPNICTLFDVGRENGSHYLVMELIEGESLAHRLQKGPLSLHDVLRYGRQIAAALDAAHSRGVVHRDLKPGNIMLTKAGAKLLDFGLAKSATEGAAINGLTNVPTEAKPLTQEGTILGTFQYMAPEQLEGLAADARTDIFALGAVLYEMTTGRRAFQAETKTSLIAAIVSQHPEPISQVTPMTPPALEHVVRKSLEKDPDDRWQSARDIAAELQWISEAGSQAGVAASLTMRRKPRERLAWALAALLAAALLTVAGLFWNERRRSNDRSHEYELAMKAPAGETFQFGSNLGWGVISPDGSRIVFPATSPKGQGLWVRSIGRNDTRWIAGSEGGFYPFWSPDGKSIGFFHRLGLKAVELGGSLPAFIESGDLWGRGGSWAKDGRILFCVGGGNLKMVPRPDAPSMDVTVLDTTRGESAHYWPQFVGEDEQRYLYFVRSSQKGYEGIYLGTLGDDGREADRKLLVASSSSGVFIAGDDPDRGHLLWVRDGGIVARALDLETGELSGQVRELGIRSEVQDSQRGAFFSVARTGTLVVSEPLDGAQQLVEVNRDGGSKKVIHAAERDSMIGPVRTSPDGSWTVFGVISQGDSDLWTYETQTSRVAPLTGGEGYDESGSVTWAPDSRSLVTARGTRGRNELIHANVLDRSVEVIALADAQATPMVLTSDGWIVLTNREGNVWAAHMRDIDNRKMLAERQYVPAVSRDHQWLLMSPVEGDSVSAQRIVWTGEEPQFAGGSIVLPIRGVDALHWTGSGAELIGITPSVVVSMPVEQTESSLMIGTPQTLFPRPAGLLWNEVVSPDGAHFYYVEQSGLEHHTLTVVSDWRSRF